MPKIVAISDTHALHEKMGQIPDGDILIHAGDLTNHGELSDVQSFNKWLGALPHKHKVVIAGNHDFCFEKRASQARSLITNAHYLEDQALTIMGVKIYGSPWQPWFYDWAFNLRRGPALAAVWAKIPLDTDVLVTHGPPFGILDCTVGKEQVGCADLLARIQDLPQIKCHIFGHIHEAYGAVTVCDKVRFKSPSIQFVNASICTLNYRPSNAAVVIEC